MSRLSIRDTAVQGLKIIERVRLRDERGFLERLFCSQQLESVLGNRSIEQINLSSTAKQGVVRGLHFQHPPHSEMKIVTCIRGEIFDVAVDLRRGSPTFLHWHAELLSAHLGRSFLIPEGFAHGFQTLTDKCDVLYAHTSPYEPSAEDGLNVSDPRLSIEWPLVISGRSDRDKHHPMINSSFLGLVI